MTHRQSVAPGRDIAARWCALAEQRLEHLTEMFETGRWRRFHTEVAFLENIQEAKRAVQTWQALATGAVPTLSPVGPFSLGWSPQGAPAREPAQVARPGTVQPPATPARSIETITLQPDMVQPDVVQPKAVRVSPEISAPVELDLDLDAVLGDLTDFIEEPIARFDEPVSALRERANVAPHLAEFTLSLDGIEAKYPLLRNSL